MNRHTSYEEAFPVIGPALISKAQELRLYGYDTATPESIWRYLTQKKWKRESESFRLHRVVQEILQVKAGDFMNFMTNEEYKQTAGRSGLEDEELQLLLHGQHKDEH
ncbi:post-transcriptional regulator [Jeotgalibacillus sp. JSM ZJ347]|uniref:post-transcriptional regulator n=1 Tax=Jeotgalibacillus sp. JSM ZJ347 TaxID=3342117 RepID=UPI0035A885E0